MDKCFCHLNGLAVKDATARKEIEKTNDSIKDVSGSVENLSKNMESQGASIDQKIIDLTLSNENQHSEMLKEIEKSYMYKGTLVPSDMSEIDNCTDTGYFNISFDDLSEPIDDGSAPSGMGIIYVTNEDGSVCIQKFVSWDGFVCRRYMFPGDSWSAWEWENAPMFDAIEYRTTKKINGSPVYVITAVVELPWVNETKSVALIPKDDKNVTIVNISGAVNVPDAHLWYPLYNSHFSFGFYDDYYQESDGSIELRISTDDDHYTGSHAYVTVEYTKD